MDGVILLQIISRKISIKAITNSINYPKTYQN